MNINYQTMDESQRVNGYYYPDYDKMMESAVTDAERQYIKELKRRNLGFTFNGVIIVRREKCGHYEILQTPHVEKWQLREIAEMTQTDCTVCKMKRMDMRGEPHENDSAGC